MNAQTERLELAGAAGRIQALRDRPEGAPRGVAVIAHPHPLFGGTMDNKVVQTVARAFVQGFEKLLGQGQIVFHPALASGMSQVQMQPEEFVGILRLLQASQGLGRIDLSSAFARTEAKPVEQAEQVRIAVALIDAVIHAGSLAGVPVVAMTGSLERHHCRVF